MADQRSSGAGDVSTEWGQNFEQCLELLRGPGDERRFVGLLLVTRLLPRGSDDAVRRVLDALGAQFLHRLLLPLRRSPQAWWTLPAEAVAHQVTSCGLALAILAAACRLPDFAAGPDVRELLPVLVQVVQCGGVSRILQPGAAEAAGSAPAAAASAAADAADADAADADAVSDALECLVGAAAAAPKLTFTALEHCPLLEALAACLTSAAAALTSVPHSAPAVGGVPDSTPAASVEAQKHHAVLLAAALLERQLAGGGGGDTGDGSGGGGGRAVAALAGHPAAAARIMAALSALVGNPRLRLPATSPAATSLGSSSAPLQSPTLPQQQQQQQQHGSDAPANRSAARQDAGGAAQLQLEALHLLLLLLRACQEPAAAAAARELVRLDEQAAWSAAVRRGLGWLLRSRAPAALRHSALQLAALVLELVGERWMLGPPGAATGTAAAPASTASTSLVQGQDQPGSFLLLLLETLKIETGLLLLQDALNPDRQVPSLDSHRSYALGQAGPTPVPSQRLLDELAARAEQRQAAEAAAVKAAVDAAAGAGLQGAADAAATDAASTSAAMDVEEEEGRPAAPDAGSAAGAFGAMPAAVAPPPTIPAGQRALVLLPACFRLLEGTVEAVAADAAVADGHMEVEGIGEAAAAAAARGAAARLPSPPSPPLLSDAMMQKLMSGLDDIADTLLKFFEASTAPQPQPQKQEQLQPQLSAGTEAAPSAPPSSAAAATAAGGGAVLLGAVRVLGRYLAEAPGAVRSGRVLRVLPLVMAARGADAAAGGVGGAAGGDLDMDLDLDLDSFALPFLLPGLLQATGPGADGRAETTRALRASPAALDACVSYLAHCVMCAVAAAPHAERALAAAAAATAGGGVGGEAAVAALARSERGMADVSMLLLNLLEPSFLGSLAVGRGAAEAVSGAEAGGAASTAWRVLRRCQAGGAAGEMQAAAAAAATWLPALLVQLLPVCWLLHRWAAAREGVLRGLLSLDPLLLPGRGGADASTAVAQLFGSQLGTRPLLCTACLAAVTLAATMSRLAVATAADGDGGSSASAETQQLAATATTTTATAAAASVILPPAVVEGVGAVALAGAAAGASLQAAQLYDTAAASAPSLYDGDGRQRLPLTRTGLAEDFLGDGEVCWERLLGACAQLVEMSGVVRRLAAVAAAPTGAAAGGAPWLHRLAAARARGDPAAEELLLSEVNLALLLQLVAAHGQTG